VEEHVHNWVMDCQRFKRAGILYGQMLPREALYQPFHEVAIYLIGPYTILALTIIKTVTTMAELVWIDNKTLYQQPKP
jgi:hypothetical protein